MVLPTRAGGRRLGASTTGAGALADGAAGATDPAGGATPPPLLPLHAASAASAPSAAPTRRLPCPFMVTGEDNAFGGGFASPVAVAAGRRGSARPLVDGAPRLLAPCPAMRWLAAGWALLALGVGGAR